MTEEQSSLEKFGRILYDTIDSNDIKDASSIEVNELKGWLEDLEDDGVEEIDIMELNDFIGEYNVGVTVFDMLWTNVKAEECMWDNIKQASKKLKDENEQDRTKEPETDGVLSKEEAERMMLFLIRQSQFEGQNHLIAELFKYVKDQTDRMINVTGDYVNEVENEVELNLVSYLIQKGYSNLQICNVLGSTLERDEQFINEVRKMVE